MNLDKGFHSGSAAWQIHDHEVDKKVQYNRKVARWFFDFVEPIREGIENA